MFWNIINFSTEFSNVWGSIKLTKVTYDIRLMHQTLVEDMKI